MKTPVTAWFFRPTARSARFAGLALMLVGWGLTPAMAQLITLAPANVIGSLPWTDGTNAPWAWNAVGSGAQYQASTIFSQQSGNVAGSAGGWNGNTWFSSPNVGGTGASLNSGYVVIDLGATYLLSSFELFNGTASYEHTGTFSILASNSIAAAADVANYGQVLSNPITLKSSTALTFANSVDPVTGQTFAVSPGAAYRYVQISITAAGSLNGGVMDIRGASLSEVRIYGSTSAVPEPSTYAALAGLGALGFAAWRRRRPVVAVAASDAAR